MCKRKKSVLYFGEMKFPSRRRVLEVFNESPKFSTFSRTIRCVQRNKREKKSVCSKFKFKSNLNAFANVSLVSKPICFFFFFEFSTISCLSSFQSMRLNFSFFFHMKIKKIATRQCNRLVACFLHPMNIKNK